MLKSRAIYFKVLFAVILVIVTYNVAIAQATYELPVVKLYNKNKKPVLISNISEYGKPMLLLTYSQIDFLSSIKVIDSLDAQYQLKTKNSPQVIAVNQDSQLPEVDVFSFASRWKNITVLFDKSEEFSKVIYTNKSPSIIFIDGAQQVVFMSSLSNLSVSTIVKIIDRIGNGEIKPDKVYFDKNDIPCISGEASYYRLLKRNATKGWVIESYYTNNNIKSSAEALLPFPTILNGKWSTYKNITDYFDRDRVLESEGWYDLNRLDGVYKSYYDYKVVKEQINYYRGSPVGKYVKNYENSNLSIEGNYSSEGLQVGEWKYFYENGTLARKVFFNDDGNLDGACSNWYPSGKLYYTLNFSDGEVVYSSIKSYRENGDKFIEFVPGLDSNKFSLLAYDEKRNLAAKIDFSGDIILASVYQRTGGLNARYTYKISENSTSVDGRCLEWYDNGRLKLDLNFAEGKPVGKATSWHENGTISQMANFDNNEMTYYDESGKKIGKPFSASCTLDFESLSEHLNAVSDFINQFYGQFDKKGNIQVPWY